MSDDTNERQGLIFRPLTLLLMPTRRSNAELASPGIEYENKEKDEKFSCIGLETVNIGLRPLGELPG